MFKKIYWKTVLSDVTEGTDARFSVHLPALLHPRHSSRWEGLRCEWSEEDPILCWLSARPCHLKPQEDMTVIKIPSQQVLGCLQPACLPGRLEEDQHDDCESDLGMRVAFVKGEGCDGWFVHGENQCDTLMGVQTHSVVVASYPDTRLFSGNNWNMQT